MYACVCACVCVSVHGSRSPSQASAAPGSYKGRHEIQGKIAEACCTGLLDKRSAQACGRGQQASIHKKKLKEDYNIVS